MNTAIVLCGGLGTRLRGVVDDRPKPLAPISGQPFLNYLLTALCQQGVREVILSTGYLGEMISEYVGDGSRWDLTVRSVEEPEPLGTAGAIRFVADTLDLEESLLVLNGDTFFSGSIDELVSLHQTKNAVATIALVRVADAARYGTVTLDSEDGHVRNFREKSGESVPGWINAGVYVLEPAILQSIDPGKKVSLERDVFPRWIGRGLYGCRFRDATFLDIGTPEDFSRAPEIFDKLGGEL